MKELRHKLQTQQKNHSNLVDSLQVWTFIRTAVIKGVLCMREILREMLSYITIGLDKDYSACKIFTYG